MTTGAYCNNADCSHEFDKPSFAEILARKRKCPACGTVNYVSDDLGTALDEAFAKVAAGTTVPQEVHKTAVEAHTAPQRTVDTLVCSAAGIVELHLPDGTTPSPATTPSYSPRKINMPTPKQPKQHKPRPFVLTNGSKTFRCSCGCNVFLQLDPNDKNRFICNSCGKTYEGV